MAASSTLSALAYAGPAGDSVLFINTMTWREKERSELKLPPMTSASGRTVLVTNLMYAEFIGKLPKPFLMVCKMHTYVYAYVCPAYCILQPLFYSWALIFHKSAVWRKFTSYFHRLFLQDIKVVGNRNYIFMNVSKIYEIC